MLKKISNLSRPKLLEKLNSGMKNVSLISPEKNNYAQAINSVTPLNLGRNLNNVSLIIKKNSSQNKSYSLPKYVPLNDRFPALPQSVKLI